MHRSWTEIRQRFSETGIDAPWLHRLISLVDHILMSPLAGELYPWTSMFDLCISQTQPSSSSRSPYLRISPQRSGQLEFRYIDTPLSAKQWSRVVAPEEAVGRFDTFVKQLHWLAKAS